MDIIQELYKWKNSHTKEEWELACKETEYIMDELNEEENEIDYFIKLQEKTYKRSLEIINMK